MAAQGVDRFGFEQGRAGAGDHHRIEHDIERGVLFERQRHGLDDLARRQHADLGGADAEVAEQRVELSRQEGYGWGMDGIDAAGVLCSQRGQGAQSMHAVRGEGLEVGLDARPAAAVGPCHGEGTKRAGVAIDLLFQCNIPSPRFVPKPCAASQNPSLTGCCVFAILRRNKLSLMP